MTRDRVIALALLLAAWGEQVSGGREQLGAHLVLATLMAVPIGFAHRRPWLPAAASALALVIYGAIGSEPDATGEIMALAGSGFLAGSRLELRGALAVLGLLTLAAVVHLALLGGIADIVFVVGIFVLPPLGFGRAVRGRRRRIEELQALILRLSEQRERTAQLAAAAERTRMTRDIEGLVASGLDEMIELARRGERLAETDPAAAAGAFDAIRTTGAEATAELRRLLRLLHSKGP